MNALPLVQLALSVLYSLLDSYTKSGAAAEQIQRVQAAITSLITVHNTDVTESQIESLRVTIPLPDWSNMAAPVTIVDAGKRG